MNTKATTPSIEQNIKPNHPLAPLTSWKTGGAADFFLEPQSREDILYGLNWAKQRNLPVHFLGQGTNVLISDQGIPGLTIRFAKLNSYKTYQEDGRLIIETLTGVLKAKVMQIFAKQKLAPALFLCGLPGDMGGGVVMNAGAGKDLSPKEFKDIVDWVQVIRGGSTLTIPKTDIKWGYRFSQGWSPGVIYKVRCSWPLTPLPDLPLRLREVALSRAKSQPLQSASAGSVFKNPDFGPSALVEAGALLGAGALIEKCKLKGLKVGEAKVSEKHGNFILNLGSAKSASIHQLIQILQKKVQAQYGIKLKPEVKYLGRWPHLS